MGELKASPQLLAALRAIARAFLEVVVLIPANVLVALK